MIKERESKKPFFTSSRCRLIASAKGFNVRRKKASVKRRRERNVGAEVAERQVLVDRKSPAFSSQQPGNEQGEGRKPVCREGSGD